MVTAILDINETMKDFLVKENIADLIRTKESIEIFVINSKTYEKIDKNWLFPKISAESNNTKNVTGTAFAVSVEDSNTTNDYDNIEIFNINKNERIDCIKNCIKKSKNEKIFFLNFSKTFADGASFKEIAGVEQNYFEDTVKNPIIAHNGDIFWSKEQLIKVFDYFENNNIDLTNCISLETILVYCSCVILKQQWTTSSILRNVYIFNNDKYNVFKSLELRYPIKNIEETINILSKHKEFNDIVDILKRSYSKKQIRLPFTHDYKYDIAITMPIYKIKKERIALYLSEIKELFSDCSYQIILSDNRPIETRDCDLSEFDDDIVSHVDNGGNIFAFGARESAFKKSNAYYIWSIDDDNYVYPECNSSIKYFILTAKKYTYYAGNKRTCGTSWLLSDCLKILYKKMEEEGIQPPSYYEEDSILERYNDLFYDKQYIFTHLFYEPNTEGYVEGEKINIEKFCETLLAFYKLYFDTKYFKETINSLLDFFKFELEDYLYLLTFLQSEFNEKIVKDIVSIINSKELSILSEAMEKGII